MKSEIYKRLSRVLYFFGRILLGILWTVAVTGFHFVYGWPTALGLFILVMLPLCALILGKERIFVIGAGSGFLGVVVSLSMMTPSNNRDWADEHAHLAGVHLSGQRVTIDGFRNFQWKNQQSFDPVWESRTFELDQLQSLDLIVEPFKDSDYMAHTMLRFGFSDGRQLIVSVEARRERSESYSLLKGAFRQFELIYVFGTPEDLLTLRAVHRGTRIYAYPIKADREFMINLFKDLATAANDLHQRPRFYRSIRENCTTTLVKHFDRQPIDHIGLRRETIFPSMTGWLLYQRGFMDTDLSYDEAKKHFRIDEGIRKFYRKL